MVTNAELYTEMHRQSGLEVVSPSYKEACQSCACNGGYSSAWTIQAAATVIRAPILSVYPPVIGMMDMCVRILNTKFIPGVSRTCVPVYLMWTYTGQTSAGTWTPNHFVSLLRNEDGKKTFAQVVASPTPSDHREIESPSPCETPSRHASHPPRRTAPDPRKIESTSPNEAVLSF